MPWRRRSEQSGRPTVATKDGSHLNAPPVPRRCRRILAEAAQSHDRVALDQQLIAQLPLIVEKAALGLAGAHLTVLNGSDGVLDIVSSLAGQGMAILDSIKNGVAGSNDGLSGRPAPLPAKV